MLGWPVDLDPKALVRKLIGEGRGGYCYEQNLLFGQVLTALGFRVTGLAGRVRWNTPDCVMTPRSHMLLRVDLDAHPHIVDVGFGVQTPTMPLRLETNVVQTSPHGRFRLIKAGDGFMLEAEVDRAWKNLYWFDVQEQLRPDYELFNYYFSTHPSSVFVTDLIAARPAPGRRHVLFNNRYTVRYVDGPVQQRALTSAVELGEVLRTEFRLSGLGLMPFSSLTIRSCCSLNRASHHSTVSSIIAAGITGTMCSRTFGSGPPFEVTSSPTSTPMALCRCRSCIGSRADGVGRRSQNQQRAKTHDQAPCLHVYRQDAPTR
ncbi:arylamine N-acetyltransferase [Bradyrhizobium sp. 157]|uniref:arylamine N-acetyltransferase family protein n=1 Tax=Bradyrhizobium sp. 157 TaxID=2782631 RepID=UPI001FFBA464